LDKNNKPFKPYKESYIKDKRFAIMGKNKNEVNLKYTRNMLNSIKLLKHAPGVLVIGFDKGKTNDIAAYNIRPTHGKVRDFLGVRPTEISKVLNNFSLPDPILVGIIEGTINRITDEFDEENNEVD
jgi:hypothetical protein